jgi:hypothetical protein
MTDSPSSNTGVDERFEAYVAHVVYCASKWRIGSGAHPPELKQALYELCYYYYRKRAAVEPSATPPCAHRAGCGTPMNCTAAGYCCGFQNLGSDEYVCQHGHSITPAGLLKIRKLERAAVPPSAADSQRLEHYFEFGNAIIHPSLCESLDAWRECIDSDKAERAALTKAATP